jgi:hypothetical protein
MLHNKVYNVFKSYKTYVRYWEPDFNTFIHLVVSQYLQIVMQSILRF